MAQDARTIDEQNTAQRARLLGIAYIDTSAILDKVLYKDLLSIQELQSLKVIPLQVTQSTIVFGITTNTSQGTMQMLSQRFADQRVTYGLISSSGFRDYMRLYDPPKSVEYRDISLTSAEQGIEEISHTLQEVRADDMLAYIVQQAFKIGASDIHLETSRVGARIRFRVHGVLHPVAILTPDKYRQLISALASAANVSTNSLDDQTGHINRAYRMANSEEVVVNLRVETVPAVNGMDAVLRLFNFKPEMLQLSMLGLSPSQDTMIREVIQHPNGLMLIVGPTGSGKTTTLYSILNELNHPERKIITLEDPVEYQIEGTTQIPVASREGVSFAEKFRAVLRLDPDVVMVGEIRDTDTAKTALQAALTGHLVLSTYHANSAAAAITRMLDAIGENPLYVSAIRLVQAQRLVRRLDDTTKQPYTPDDQTKQMLQKILENLPQHIPRPHFDTIQLFRPGASPENPFGYNGQFAIRELLTITPAMQQLLRKPAREISTEAIEQVATEGGMLTMLEEGVLRAIAGETSLEEVYRVLG
jgi:type II secretory ATPase GspE/PulE/Tfp pilus assembly ATPase PilB-like protein